MQAAVIQSFEAPPRYGLFDDPVAGEGEIIIDVAAAGLHQIVKALARGTHYGSTGKLPFIPGVDGVGRLPDGSRVYFFMARPPFGTFAQRAVTRPENCVPLPDGLDDPTAAGSVNPGMSSLAALKLRARFLPGESVLVLGATGIAGQLAVQIAKRIGARRVIGAGRNPEALEKLKSLGADAAISLEQDRADLISAFRAEFAGGVDVVLDYLWGDPSECALEAIGQKGLQHVSSRIRFIQIGSMAAKTISLAADTLRSSKVELLGSGFGAASIKELLGILPEFFAESARQPFETNLEAVPLSEVEALWNQPGKRLVFVP